jgi:hypothetical protein
MYNAPLETAGFFMRFTIRDVVWLTLLVAMGVAWWLDRSRLIAKLQLEERVVDRFTAELEANGISAPHLRESVEREP